MAITRVRAGQISGLSLQQAPYLIDVIPDSFLPSTTGDVDIYGEFFIPQMTVDFEGQTVNYLTFINSQHVKVNVTRGAAEGTFSVTLNNGIESVWNNAILIVLGEVFEPVDATDWTVTQGSPTFEKGAVNLLAYDQQCEAEWTKEMDFNRDFSVRLNFSKSSLGVPGYAYRSVYFQLLNVSDASSVIGLSFNRVSNGRVYVQCLIDNAWVNNILLGVVPDINAPNAWLEMEKKVIDLRSIGKQLDVFVDGNIKADISIPMTENVKASAILKTFDIGGIKYIELAT
jgi:hypothetical protein